MLVAVVEQVIVPRLATVSEPASPVTLAVMVGTVPPYVIVALLAVMIRPVAGFTVTVPEG